MSNVNKRNKARTSKGPKAATNTSTPSEEESATTLNAADNVEDAMVQPAEHTVSSREPERQDLAADVEAFLAQGGQVESVPKDFRADPPRKPENNYGRGSI